MWRLIEFRSQSRLSNRSSTLHHPGVAAPQYRLASCFDGYRSVLAYQQAVGRKSNVARKRLNQRVESQAMEDCRCLGFLQGFQRSFLPLLLAYPKCDRHCVLPCNHLCASFHCGGLRLVRSSPINQFEERARVIQLAQRIASGEKILAVGLAVLSTGRLIPRRLTKNSVALYATTLCARR